MRTKKSGSKNDVLLDGGVVGAIVGLFLSAAAAAFAIQQMRSAHVAAASAGALATAVSLGVAFRSFARKLQLSDEGLTYRDTFMRTVVIPYERVTGIEYWRRLSLRISIGNERQIRWPARVKGIEPFIEELTDRVTRIHPIAVAGDLEAVSKDSDV